VPVHLAVVRIRAPQRPLPVGAGLSVAHGMSEKDERLMESVPIRVSGPVKARLTEIRDQMKAEGERLHPTYDDAIRKLLNNQRRQS
jgi:hypothetical protein